MIAIRVLRDGRPVREHVFSALPISIGRSAACDLALTDASISRAHARIQAAETGGVELVDGQSRNGVVANGGRVERVALAGKTRARLGAVELEIELFEDTPTGEFRWTEPEPPPAEERHFRLHPLLSLVLGVGVPMISIAAEPSFWSPAETDRLVSMLSIGLGLLIMLPLLATGLFVVYKVFGRRVRWSDGLQALALLTLVLPVIDAVGLSSYYVLSAGGRETLLTWVGVAAGVLAVVVLAEVRRSPPHLGFRLAWGFAALAMVLVSMWIAGLSARKKGEPALDFYVQAPLLGWTGRAQTLESYEARVSKAAAAARSAADRVRKEQQRD